MGRKQPAETTLPPWTGGTGELPWAGSSLWGRRCRPLGWGDGAAAVGSKRPAGTRLPPPGLGGRGAASHMGAPPGPTPLVSPEKTLCLSLSFRCCEMALAVPDGGESGRGGQGPACCSPRLVSSCLGPGGLADRRPHLSVLPRDALGRGGCDTKPETGPLPTVAIRPMASSSPVPSLHQQARFRPANCRGAQPHSPGSECVHDRTWASLGAQGFLTGRSGSSLTTLLRKAGFITQPAAALLRLSAWTADHRTVPSHHSSAIVAGAVRVTEMDPLLNVSAGTTQPGQVWGSAAGSLSSRTP